MLFWKQEPHHFHPFQQYWSLLQEVGLQWSDLLKMKWTHCCILSHWWIVHFHGYWAERYLQWSYYHMNISSHKHMFHTFLTGNALKYFTWLEHFFNQRITIWPTIFLKHLCSSRYTHSFFCVWLACINAHYYYYFACTHNLCHMQCFNNHRLFLPNVVNSLEAVHPQIR